MVEGDDVTEDDDADDDGDKVVNTEPQSDVLDESDLADCLDEEEEEDEKQNERGDLCERAVVGLLACKGKEEGDACSCCF